MTKKETTLRSVLSGETGSAGYRLYLLRDGATVFYAGQSMSIRMRLAEHMGYGRGGIDQVGEFILANWPAAEAWIVELYQSTDRNVDACEQDLIRLHRPCLNRTHNAEPSDIPQQYRIPARWTAENPHAEHVAELLGLGA